MSCRPTARVPCVDRIQGQDTLLPGVSERLVTVKGSTSQIMRAFGLILSKVEGNGWTVLEDGDDLRFGVVVAVRGSEV